MANVLYTVPISGKNDPAAIPINLITYNGNTSGYFSTYNNSLCAIYAGSIGANPGTIYNQYVPGDAGASDIDRFEPGRSYIIRAISNFNLGVSGTRTQAISDKRYIHSFTPGIGGSEVNTVGFDPDVATTPLSAGFAKWEGQDIYAYANYDELYRGGYRRWTPGLQLLANGNNGSFYLNNPAYIFHVYPLSSYLVISKVTTTLSAARTPGYLQTDNKDNQNDPVFLVTDAGQYIRLS